MKTILVKVAAAALLIAPFGIATVAHAATYAFVNQSKEVSTVNANDWMTAIATALNIDIHSGVLLLDSQNGNIVGTSI